MERCTFCEKRRHHVASLIAGPPGVNSCHECIDICKSILQEEHRRPPGAGQQQGGAAAGTPACAATEKLPPAIEISRRLDVYVICHQRAKNVLSVAV